MEKQIEQLKAEISAKDATIAEMKAAADAQHAEAEKLGKLAEEAAVAGKAATEALEAKNAEIEQLKTDFAAQLAGKDADIAERERQYAAMRAEFDTWRAEQEARNANLRAELEAANAEETATLKARIAELEAAAKTAEQIAAEKYAAGSPPIPASPAGDPGNLQERLAQARKNPAAFAALAKELTPDQIKAL